VNVPALTERTLRRDIVATEFSTETEIQVIRFDDIACFYELILGGSPGGTSLCKPCNQMVD